MHHAPIHPAERFLVNIAPGHNRGARNKSAAQTFCNRDDVRLQIPMLKAEHLSGPAQTSLNFIGDEQRSVFSTQFLSPNEEVGLRGPAAFSLHGLDHERRDVAL